MSRSDKYEGEGRLVPLADTTFPHMFAQTQRRRGLRGGPPVLAEARASYLGVEYSGDADRRLPAGILVRQRI